MSPSLTPDPSTSSIAVIRENSVTGTLLANLTVTDQDAGQEHFCSLAQGQDIFAVRKLSPTSAEVVLKNVSVDYEEMRNTPIQGNRSLYIIIHILHVSRRDISEQCKEKMWLNHPAHFLCGSYSAVHTAV